MLTKVRRPSLGLRNSVPMFVRVQKDVRNQTTKKHDGNHGSDGAMAVGCPFGHVIRTLIVPAERSDDLKSLQVAEGGAR